MITLATASQSLERIDACAFDADRLAARTPAIVVGAMDNWTALRTWSPAYLASCFPSRPVNVAVSGSHKYDYTAASSAFEPLTAFRKEQMSFAELVNRAERSDPSGVHYYLMQRPIATEFPELVGDFETPPWIEGRTREINLWLGSAGNVTQMHYDRWDNFLAEVQGRKHVRLFDPAQTEFLYAYPKDSVMNYLSWVDCDHPDFDRFPAFRKATALEGVLSPGEMLYLPAGWWHQVRSIDLAISINFWWEP